MIYHFSLPPVQQEVIKLIFSYKWLQMFCNSRATLQHPSVFKKRRHVLVQTPRYFLKTAIFLEKTLVFWKGLICVAEKQDGCTTSATETF